jgi:SAM-dependent methyltransferase
MKNDTLIENLFGSLVKEATKDLIPSVEEDSIFDFCDFGNYLSIWSTVDVIEESLKLLKPKDKILDIGSGIGKFCLIGARLYPHIHFTGIEMSERRIIIANRLKEAMNLDNVTFVHADFCDVYKDYLDFKYVYTFNPFDMGVHEKMKQENNEDDDVEDDAMETFRQTLNSYLSNLKKGSKFYSNNPCQGYPETYRTKFIRYNWLLTKK